MREMSQRKHRAVRVRGEHPSPPVRNADEGCKEAHDRVARMVAPAAVVQGKADDSRY